MNTRTLLALGTLAALTLTVRPAGAQSPTVYDPSLGTLPQQQGWTPMTTSSSSPTVSGGALLQGPTSYGGTEYWQSTAPTGTGWDFTHDTLTITARLNDLSSSYYDSFGQRRAGYYFFASDSQGRYFQFGISSDRVFLDRDNNAPSGGPLQALFDTSGFHNYRVAITPSGAQAFIDGSLVTSASLGPAGANGTLNTVFFGDGSILGNSQTQLSRFQFSVAPAPEPSQTAALALGTLALSGLILRARKSKKATS